MRNPALLSLLLICGCGGGGDECTVDTSYHPTIDAANFVDGVTNPLFPLTPGTQFVYESADEHIQVDVTTTRKTILGISCIEVHDVASVAGSMTEDTLDWYAQDRDGNVWYMGEDTKELDHGTVTSTDGSWEAGIDNAKPGIIIPATPIPNQPYRQEYKACEAEDFGTVLSTAETITGPTGTFTSCLHTTDTTPLEPDVVEDKFYCPNVGLVLTIDQATGVHEDLISKTP